MCLTTISRRIAFRGRTSRSTFVHLRIRTRKNSSKLGTPPRTTICGSLRPHFALRFSLDCAAHRIAHIANAKLRRILIWCLRRVEIRCLRQLLSELLCAAGPSQYLRTASEPHFMLRPSLDWAKPRIVHAANIKLRRREKNVPSAHC